MAIYRFRVTFEDYDDVYRDIEVRSNQTFEGPPSRDPKLAIGFDASSRPRSTRVTITGRRDGNHITRAFRRTSCQIASLRKARLWRLYRGPASENTTCSISLPVGFSYRADQDQQDRKITGPLSRCVPPNLLEKPRAIWHQSAGPLPAYGRL